MRKTRDGVLAIAGAVLLTANAIVPAPIEATTYLPQGVGGGGAMSSLSLSPYDPDLWFVATDMGILFRSMDRGVSWQPVDQAHVSYSSNLDYSVSVGFLADPDIVFFANEGQGPLRSPDKGETWYSVLIPIAADERIKYWVGHSENENVMFAATDEGLYRSIDKGVSWEACAIAGPSLGTFLDYSAGHLYHATPDGIFRSTNLGDSFTSYHVPAVLPLHCFAGGRDEHGLTLAYIDGDGVNAVGPWIQAYIDSGIEDGADQDDYDWSVETSGFVWVKPAGETEFAMVEHHQTYNLISTESTHLYGGGGLRLVESSVFQGIVTEDQYSLGGIHMAENDSQVIYVIGNRHWPRMYGNKTFVTTDAGQTWEKRFQISDWDNGYVPWPADRLEHSAVGLEVGWWDGDYESFVVNQRNSAVAGGTGYFFLHVTEDTGQHWRAPFTDFADDDPREVGKKWSSTGLEVTGLYHVEFHPTNNQLMYVAMADLGGYVSEDGGQSVRICDAGINSNYDYAFDPSDDQVVYAATSTEHDWPNAWHKNISAALGGIFRSDNRGRTWTRLTPDDDTYDRSFLSVGYDSVRDILYGGSHGDGVARSRDGGSSWHWFNTGLPAGQGRIIARLELDANGNVYALLTGDYVGNVGTNQASTGIYFLDVEGGATSWQLLRGTLHLPGAGSPTDYWSYPINFAVDPNDPDVLWLVDNERGWLTGGIWKSTDRGANWNRLTQFTFPRSIAIDPTDSNRVFVSGNWDTNGSWGEGGLLYTMDGGTTWNKNTRVPFKQNATSAALDPGVAGQVWYSFLGAGLLYGQRPDIFDYHTPPTVPPDFSAALSDPQKIQLSWSPSTGIVDIKGYQIYRVTSHDGYRNYCVGFVEGTSYEDTGLLPGITYRYHIRAEDVDGNLSPFTSQAFVDTLPAGVPSLDAPDDLVATLRGPSLINLAWQDNSVGELGFKIERLNGNSGTGYEQVAEVPAETTSHTDPGLEYSTKYFYRVRAFDGSENSYYSNIDFAVTAADAQQIFSDDFEDGQLTAWSGVSGG